MMIYIAIGILFSILGIAFFINKNTTALIKLAGVALIAGAVVFSPHIMSVTPSCVGVETQFVDVTITEQKNGTTRYFPIAIGGKNSLMPQFKESETIVSYEGVEYIIEGDETYEKYKDKVGQTAKGTLEIRTYEDGSAKYNITELQ